MSHITICLLVELRASSNFLCRNQGKILVFILSFFLIFLVFLPLRLQGLTFFIFLCSTKLVFHYIFNDYFVFFFFFFHSNFCNSPFTMDTRDFIVALGSLKLYKVFGKKMIQAHHFFHECWALIFLLCL
jgi:hypothetical protein